MATDKTKTKKSIKIPRRVIIIAVVIAVLALVLAVASIFGGSQDEAAPQQTSVSNWKCSGTELVSASDAYTLVAESDTYKLFYYEPRFSIMLENKDTGVIIESTLSDEMDDGVNNASWTGYMKSGVVIYAIIGTTNTYQVDMNTCENTIETYYIDNGICANIYFTEYEFGLSVEVILEDDELVVRVPDGSIREDKPGTYISTVSLFPFMGYSYLGEKNGYMFVPDGNGALIYLEDKEGRYATGFSRLIYGVDAGFEQSGVTSYLWERFRTVTDANNVVAPIFGMAHTDDGMAYLAIVESGDERCSIESQPNGVMVNYNRCFAKFLLRDVFVQPLNNSNSGTVKTVESDRLHSDLQVRYCLLSGDEANYSGMANTYREYLIENGQVEEKDCSYNTRIDFLGSDREEFLMGTTAVTMTTVENLDEMFTQLREAGVENVLAVYRGWQDGGIYSLPIYDYEADKVIGSTEELTAFISEQAELGYNVYLYNDALLVNDDTNAFTFDVMKMINKRTFKLQSRAQVYDLFYYLMPNKADEALNGFVAQTSEAGVDRLALAGISNSLYSYSSMGRYYDRTFTMNSFVDTVSGIDGECDLVLEDPNAYLWKYTDAYLDMPMGSSDYLYVDEEIPFLSMVFKGVLPMYSEYVNFEANKTENFLQMVESGVYPSFYLTYEDASKLIYTNSSDLYSLEYSSYYDTVIEYDAALSQLAEVTEGAHIIGHEIIKTGVNKVTYDNGVVIYINYTSSVATADGVTIPALSYKVGE